MELKPKLSTFFLLVIVFVAGIVSLIAYGWRTNTPGNIVTEDGVDIHAPYYETVTSSENPHKDHGAGHDESNTSEGNEDTHGDSHGEEGHGSEHNSGH